MARLLVYYAHPGHKDSHVNRCMARAAAAVPDIDLVDLYRGDRLASKYMMLTVTAAGELSVDGFLLLAFLFPVGLELEPRMLWSMRHRLLGLSGLQVTVTALAVMGIALALGQPWSIALAFVVIGSNYLTRPIFRLIAGARLRELFTAVALVLVVGLANSEYRHELESDIDRFKGLLLGLFFITVGASIRFDLLLASFGEVMAMTSSTASSSRPDTRPSSSTSNPNSSKCCARSASRCSSVTRRGPTDQRPLEN